MAITDSLFVENHDDALRQALVFIIAFVKEGTPIGVLRPTAKSLRNIAARRLIKAHVCIVGCRDQRPEYFYEIG